MSQIQLITLFLSDTEQNIPFTYNENTKVQTIFDRLKTQNNYSDHMRLLLNGQVLNGVKDKSFKESGIKIGDTIYVLNHLKYNHIQEQIKMMREKKFVKSGINVMQSQKDKFKVNPHGLSSKLNQTQQQQESETKRSPWNFLFSGFQSKSNHDDSNNSSSEKARRNQFNEREKEDENIGQEATPELIAQITGAKSILKPQSSRMHGFNHFGGGNEDQIFEALHTFIMHRARDEGVPVEMSQMNSIFGGLHAGSAGAGDRSIFLRQREAERQQRHERRHQERQPDPAMIKSLTEMGFEEERSKRVLRHFRNNLNMAMDYLINTPPENDAILNHASGNSGSAAEQFVPNPDSLTMLVEMGYTKEDAIYALKVTSNNLEHACTYLISNPNPSQQSSRSSAFGNLFSHSRQQNLQEQSHPMLSSINQPRQGDPTMSSSQRLEIQAENNRLTQALSSIMRATEQFNQINQQSASIFRPPGRGFSHNFGSSNSENNSSNQNSNNLSNNNNNIPHSSNDGNDQNNQ